MIHINSYSQAIVSKDFTQIFIVRSGDIMGVDTTFLKFCIMFNIFCLRAQQNNKIVKLCPAFHMNECHCPVYSSRRTGGQYYC